MTSEEEIKIQKYQDELMAHAEKVISDAFNGEKKCCEEDPDLEGQMLRNFAEDVSFVEEEFGFSIEASIKIVLAWKTWRELQCG